MAQNTLKNEPNQSRPQSKKQYNPPTINTFPKNSAHNPTTLQYSTQEQTVGQRASHRKVRAVSN